MKTVPKNIAFNLFRAWTKNAAKEFPENDFSIFDEGILVNDLLSATKLGNKPFPLKYPKLVNKLRKEMGLGPLGAYLKNFN